MRCEVCQGVGYIITNWQDKPTPCFECNGFAIIACCDGLQCQPETEAAESQDGNRPPV